MKVLWFANTPCGAIKKLSAHNISGGWLSALEQHLVQEKNVELHVAFYYSKRIDDFEYEGVYYHPLYDSRFNGKLNILIGNYREYFFGLKNHAPSLWFSVIDRVKPDLIHIHGTELDFGLVQKVNLRVPVVVSIQGVLNSCYEKLYSGIPLDVVSKYESLFQKLTFTNAKMSEKRFRFGAKREREILKNSKYVIGRTDFDRHATLAINPCLKYFTGDEILRTEFYSAEWAKSKFNERFTIISTISSGYYKGLEVILRTARNLKAIGFDFRWYVIGHTELSRNAKTMSKWLGESFSENHVEMLGYKTGAEIVGLLGEADVFCQVGHIENSPNSVCEAMMLGVPIVASYAGGTSSILEHGKEGYLLQDGDSYSLAGTLIEVSRNFSQAKEWGMNARKRALVRHNPQRVVKEYVDIYTELVNK